LGARYGQAAYDLNSAGDDAYSIYRDSRVVALTTQADPNQGTGSSLNKDEGLMAAGTPPAPPPKPGKPAGAGSNVSPATKGGVAIVRFGSTACR